MKVTYDNAFCMDSKCIHYFEDTCMVAMAEKGTEIEPDNIPGRLRDSKECKEFKAGTFLAYEVDLKEEDFSMKIKIKYFSKDYPRLEKIKKGDWVDLRVDNIKQHLINDNQVWYLGNDKNWDKMIYQKGDIIKFGLGVAMELQEGYEAIVIPRSSTFKRWGLIQTNSVGLIDNSYKGGNDEWQIEFIAMRDGVINRFDRVCQFRIQKNQPEFKFVEVEHLGNEDRGGFGSTGR